MNTSVLFRDLLELVDGSDKGSVSVFAKTLREYYVGAVDIQVLSPDAEVIMHEPENKLQYSEYLALLRDVKGGIVYHRKALKEVLNVFRGPGNGYQDYTVVEIDTTPFEQEGILVIDIQVGEGEATGSFDLFAGDVELPTEGFPDDALASKWDISPGRTGRIRYRFACGQRFKLGATGSWSCEKGSTNAFLVQVSVMLAETGEAEASS